MPNLVALLTVSEDSEAVLAHTFPWIPVFRARPVVDGSVFFPDDQERRQRIGFTISRRPDEREQLLHILRARGVLDGWELVPIAGRSEASTAEILRSYPIFLSFSDREGFGLPPAEAMASGCYVIGFPASAGGSTSILSAVARFRRMTCSPTRGPWSRPLAASWPIPPRS